MKKLLLIVVCILLISCSDKSKIKNEIDEYVAKNFNDPNSYELIDLKLIDTITEKKVSIFLKKERLNKIEKIKNFIKEKEEENGRLASRAFFGGNRFYLMNTVDKLDKEKKILDSYEKDSIKLIKDEIRVLEKFTSSNKTSHFRYLHEYRAKNDVGALVKCTDTLRINNELKLILDFPDFIIRKYGVGLE